MKIRFAIMVIFLLPLMVLAQQDVKPDEQSKEERTAAMIKKYGKNKGKLIAQGKVWSTISYEMARDSWGEPLEIKKTELRDGHTERWTYSNSRYLFFKNDRLETWQD